VIAAQIFYLQHRNSLSFRKKDSAHLTAAPNATKNELIAVKPVKAEKARSILLSAQNAVKTPNYLSNLQMINRYYAKNVFKHNRI
jgi:hypothetical protein